MALKVLIIPDKFKGTLTAQEAAKAIAAGWRASRPEDELELLPGIGVRAAERIVAFRLKQKFTRIQQLVRVKGFGRKKFLKLQPFLVVQGESTFRLEKRNAMGRVTVTTAARLNP